MVGSERISLDDTVAGSVRRGRRDFMVVLEQLGGVVRFTGWRCRSRSITPAAVVRGARLVEKQSE